MRELEHRRDAMLEQLEGLPAVRPEGGWSLLLDTQSMGIDPQVASARLPEQKVAATPMTAWADALAPRYLRLVFSNEPVERINLQGWCPRWSSTCSVDMPWGILRAYGYVRVGVDGVDAHVAAASIRLPRSRTSR